VDLTLSLQEDDLSIETRLRLVRELCTVLNREADVPARLVEAPETVGSKGLGVTDVVTLFLAHKGIDMAAGVFATYVLRHPALKIVLRRKDGREFLLTFDGLKPEHLPATIGALRAYVAAPSEKDEPSTVRRAPEPST
jgi:hypothetical protein